MSRKKRRLPAKRKPKAITPSLIRKILMEDLGDIDKILALDSDPQLNLAAGKPQIKPVQKKPLESLPQLLPNILEMYPQQFRCDENFLKTRQFSVKSIHADMIVGTCLEDEFEYQIYVQLTGEPPAGCNCEDSDGSYPCPHSYHFNHWLLRQVGNRLSPISKKIASKQLDGPSPKISQFRTDPNIQQVKRMQKIFDSLKKKIDNSTATQNEAIDRLGPTEVVPVQRVVWNFVSEANGFFVECLLQSAKKRGGGWTKGKRLRLDELHEYDNVLTTRDLQVKKLISVHKDYYRSTSYSLPPLATAAKLVGADNVLLNGQPAKIVLTEPKLHYLQINEQCVVQVAVPNKRAACNESYFAAIDLDQNRLEVATLHGNQSEIMRSFNPPLMLPLRLKPGLLNRLKLLEKEILIDYHGFVESTREAESYSMVLLLRMEADGTLRYGWRIRLGNGQLAQVAIGNTVRQDEVEGNPVQYIRCFDFEYQAQQFWSQHLDLEPHATEGSLTDFEQILSLLQELRQTDLNGNSQAPAPLEVLYDQESQAPAKFVGTVTPSNLKVAITTGRDWFQLSGMCDFGDHQIDMQTLLKNLQQADAESIRGNYVRLGDLGWAKISESLKKHLQRLHDSVNEERKNLVFDATSANIVNELLDHQVQVDTSEEWDQCLQRIEKAKSLNPKLPRELNADLRPYQVEGFAWMRRLAEWGVGGVLADDMGLGKTLQTLAVLVDRRDVGPALVIAPTSVGFNWIRETQRFAPNMNPILYRESDREAMLNQLKPGDIVVCSYGLALRDEEKLSEVVWGNLVLDEAQAIKNARSKTALALSKIKAEWKIALTGTPVENHLGELWSLFRAVAPGVFGGWEQFRRRFAGPIEREQNDERRLALRDRLKPFILRRTKSEVLTDLPPRTDSNVFIELSAEEQEIYNRVRMSAIGELDEIAKLDDVKDQRFRILALLTRLRQLACSPKLVHEDWSGRASKLQALADTLLELKSEGHRTLIFSQFVGHLQLIKQILEEEGISYQYLDGSTTPNKRQEAVDQFQQGQTDVFLISLKAGGSGLNLTAADYVIHMDPWWNPAVEDQATDRAHRIGQDKPVIVYRMIAQGTIEEEILKLHETKRDLVAGILEGSQAAAKLSTDDLVALIRSDA